MVVIQTERDLLLASRLAKGERETSRSEATGSQTRELLKASETRFRRDTDGIWISLIQCQTVGVSIFWGYPVVREEEKKGEAEIKVDGDQRWPICQE